MVWNSFNLICAYACVYMLIANQSYFIYTCLYTKVISRNGLMVVVDDVIT